MSDYISASQIKKHKKCPKQYWYRYVSDEHEETAISKGHRELGSAVHEAIEDYLKGGNPINNETEILKGLRIELADTDYDYPDDMESDAQDCIEGAARFLEGLDEDIIGIEEKFNFKIKKPGFHEEFIGYVDVATENKIIDWKTGSTIRKDDEEIQGAVYLAGFMHEYGYPPDEIQFVYLKKGEMSRHTSVDDDGEVVWDDETNKYWDEMIEYARNLVQSWEQDKWPASPGESRCHWCSYRYFCEEGNRGVEHLPYPYLEP